MSCNWVLTGIYKPLPGPDARTSGLAIISLVLGVLSVFTLLLTAIPAIILGIVSLVKIEKSGGHLKGKGLAIAGFAIPACLMPVVLMMALLIPALARTRTLAQRVACAAHLKGLANAMIVYTTEYDGRFPTSGQWCDLLIDHADVCENSFRCPSACRSSACGYKFSYGFNANLDGLTIDDVPADTVLMFEIDGGWNVAGGPEIISTNNHRGEGCHIVFADGYVEFVRTENLQHLKWTVPRNE
jgi:competence protein ComGC